MLRVLREQKGGVSNSIGGYGMGMESYQNRLLGEVTLELSLVGWE